MYSEEHFLYSSGEDVGIEDSDPPSNTKDFIILTENKIKQLQDKVISEVSNVLSVSRGIACTLLLRHKWNLNSVVEKWLANDDGVSDVIAPVPVPKSDNDCQICFERVENGNVLSLPCGHPFCGDCWRNYLASSINDGPGCLNLRCPEPNCKTTVGLDMVESLLSDDDLNKYYHHLYRSYIECSTNRKWCPAPGCEYAVEFSAGGCDSYDVTCDCSCKFCWNCTEECHRPVDCETVVNWTKKNKSDGANFTWISVNTKPCPKCKRPIQKHDGCNHMRCEKQCGFRFCWLCLVDLSGVHRCNMFREKRKQDRKSFKDMKIELAKYGHYYERWTSNDKSRDTALVQMNRAMNEHVPILSLVQGQAENLQRCVAEAWEQIVECRRVLKWTYAYGYYMDVDKVKKSFFEYLQGEAESALERLHSCAAKEMDKYVEASSRCHDFPDFQSKLTCLTKVTGKYFQNLVKAMENNLCEVQTRKRRRMN